MLRLPFTAPSLVTATLVAASLVGCAGSEGETPNPDPVDDGALTYADDTGPLMQRACVSCHQEGGIGPFALDNYDAVSEWAEASLAAMQARTMPPWGVVDDGSCRDFRDSRWLDDADIEMFAAWIDDGKAQGDADATFDDETPVLQQLDGTTASYNTPTFFPEAEGTVIAQNDEYRCFRIDPALTSTQFLTGYDVIPGNQKTVHHVLVMPVDPAGIGGGGRTNDEVMTDLDEQSPDRLGWPCFGAAGDGVAINGIPVSWAPGQGAVNYPDGTGVRVEAGEELVVQVHYNLIDPADVGSSDSTEVVLEWADSVEKEGWFVLPDALLESLANFPLIDRIPAGETAYNYSFTRSFGDMIFGSEAKLWGVMPHMHEKGKAQTFDVVQADGTEVCASRVDRWDFNWQGFYMFEEPIDVTTGDEARITCVYDTSGDTEDTLPGWGTTSEMCLVVMFLTEP